MASNDFDKDKAEDKARDISDEASDKVAELGDATGGQTDGLREKAVSGLGRTAAQLREKSGSISGAGKEAGEKVAHGVESAADYIHEHKSKEMFSDARRFAKDHPMKTAVGAVILAFILGRVMS